MSAQGEVPTRHEAGYRHRCRQTVPRHFAGHAQQHPQASRAKMKSAMKYLVVIEKGPKSFGAYVPDLPGCVAIGETRAQVKKLICEAIELHLEMLLQSGQRIPKPQSGAEYITAAV